MKAKIQTAFLFVRFAISMILDILLLPVWILGAPIVSLFTKPQPDLDEDTKPWGGWFGTYDNPPQGDKAYITRRAFFPNITKGWKGYLNRVGWLWRNPGYNFQKMLGIDTPSDRKITWKGREDISDKNKVPGWYFATMEADGNIKAFEFYMIKPYGDEKCLRVRLGWKIMTSKIDEYGFAVFVDTITPRKKYGR